MLFERNPVHRLALFLAHEVGINLSGGEVLVDEHLRHGVDIGATGKLPGGVGVAGDMHNSNKSNEKKM